LEISFRSFDFPCVYLFSQDDTLRFHKISKVLIRGKRSNILVCRSV
jgi:hypothetical protein